MAYRPYIIKIFSESQAQALLQGCACIDEKVIQRTVETLAIKVPRTYTAGTHISDFEIGGQVPEPPPELEELPRQYANKRGARQCRGTAATCLSHTTTASTLRRTYRKTDIWRLIIMDNTDMKPSHGALIQQAALHRC